MPGALIIEKLRTLLGLRYRRSVPSELRPVIDEAAVAWPFTDAAVDISPTAPGVYLLYKDGQLIHIGLAVNGSGIRQELESHRCGAHGAPTSDATAFLFQIAADPVGLHRQYVEAYRARHGEVPGSDA